MPSTYTGVFTTARASSASFVLSMAYSPPSVVTYAELLKSATFTAMRSGRLFFASRYFTSSPFSRRAYVSVSFVTSIKSACAANDASIQRTTINETSFFNSHHSSLWITVQSYFESMGEIPSVHIKPFSIKPSEARIVIFISLQLVGFRRKLCTVVPSSFPVSLS